jgi:hypothetical protein
MAHNSHTCSLRSILCQVHAPAQNDLNLFSAYAENSAKHPKGNKKHHPSGWCFLCSQQLIKLAESDGLQVIQRIAYILNASANKRDMGMLNVVDYVDWLEDIEPFDLLVASTDIFAVYFGGKATESTVAEAAKKNNLSQMIGQ